MYCIRKYADCWAIFNLVNDSHRALTEDERLLAEKEVEALGDVKTVAWYGDHVDFLNDKP